MLRPLLLAALLAAPAVAGCGSRGSVDSQTAALAAAPSDSAVLLPINAAGLLARVSDGRARATLVNVWATWCPPCREEFPAMVAVANQHRAEGLRLLLVSGDFGDQLPEARRFLEANGARDTSYYKDEADMAFINGVHQAWSGALPATLLFDSHGKLLDFWEGGADSVRFERAVANALHPGGPQT